MKCDSCGITISEQPEDATPDMLLCDSCEACDTITSAPPAQVLPLLWQYLSERDRNEIAGIMANRLIDIDRSAHVEIAAKLTA